MGFSSIHARLSARAEAGAEEESSYGCLRDRHGEHRQFVGTRRRAVAKAVDLNRIAAQPCQQEALSWRERATRSRLNDGSKKGGESERTRCSITGSLPAHAALATARCEAAGTK